MEGKELQSISLNSEIDSIKRRLETKIEPDTIQPPMKKTRLHVHTEMVDGMEPEIQDPKLVDVEKSPDDDPLEGLPNEAALKELIKRTGYMITQENGQRKYGGPPPNWDDRATPRGAEVFVGKIPRDVFEDELVPVFERVGRIYELRLMMDFDGKNRGYAFVMFTTKSEAKLAVKKLNNFEIRKGRLLGVCYSVDNCRLFVGGIPKNKKKEDIFTEMSKVTDGVCEVIVYPSASDKTKNRGFAFVEYESHRAAAMARRKLIPGRIQLWGHPIAVDWAEPEQEVDEDIMQQVKVLYVRNLMLDTSEDTLQIVFSQFSPGCVERVKKIRDYAFVHFTTRDACVEAMRKINGSRIDDAEVEVTLAKPVDKNDHNRMAKVGAKVLAQGSPETSATPAIVTAPSPNGMVVFPNGVVGTTDLSAYFQPNTLLPVKRNERGRNNVGRNSYLGYSAGKATYGRYYAKNNQERCYEVAGNSYEVQQTAVSAAELSTAMYKPAMSAISTAPAYAPAVQQILPTTVLAQQTTKTSEQLLEEACIRNMWGSPVYQLMTIPSSDNRQLFFYKITIPALASMGPQFAYFQPNKFSVTVEEAKTVAAEYVLSLLNLHPESTPLLLPMTQMISSSAGSAGYQSFLTQPGLQVRSAPPNQAFVQAPASSPNAAFPMTFVDPTLMQPITVMYQ